MNALERTMQDITRRAALETAAPRLTPKERARREAARHKDRQARVVAATKKRAAALAKRRERLQEQLAKATERVATVRDALKDCEAAIKASVKGTK